MQYIVQHYIKCTVSSVFGILLCTRLFLETFNSAKTAYCVLWTNTCYIHVAPNHCYARQQAFCWMSAGGNSGDTECFQSHFISVGTNVGIVEWLKKSLCSHTALCGMQEVLNHIVYHYIYICTKVLYIVVLCHHIDVLSGCHSCKQVCYLSIYSTFKSIFCEHNINALDYLETLKTILKKMW